MWLAPSGVSIGAMVLYRPGLAVALAEQSMSGRVDQASPRSLCNELVPDS